MRKKFPILLLIVVLLTSLGSPVRPAQALSVLTPADPVRVGQLGGVTNTVVFNGNQLFFNVGPRIVRLDVPAGSPGAPAKPGIYSDILPGIPVDIKVANGFIYMAMGVKGVAIVDAASMLIVANLALPLNSYANAIAVGRNYLYVAAGNTGIIYYNLGPTKNQLLLQGILPFNTPIRKITDVETTLAGSVESLYASANNNAGLPANAGGVVKFDISLSPDLTSPVSTVEGIDINFLAVSSSNVFAGGKNTLYVLNPDTLASAGSLAPVHTATNISLSPDAKNVYLISSNGLDVIDVNTPSTPVLKTPTPFVTQGSIRDVAAAVFSGSTNIFLFIADNYAGLSIASSPQAAPQTITLDSPGYVLARPAMSRAVSGFGSQVFIDSNYSDLLTFNASNLNNLMEIGLGVGRATSNNSMIISHNMLLVAGGYQGLLRYNISDGSEPLFIDSFTLPDNAAAYGLVVEWPNAIVAAGHDGFYIVNIDGPMSVLGSTLKPLPGSFLSDFESVDWQGNFAYVADLDGNLRIYDMSDLSGPLPTNGFLAQSGMSDVKVSGNFAFLACGINGVKVADITDKTNPVFIPGAGYATAPGLAQHLIIYNNYLFVAAGTSGVIILAIQPNGQLTFVTSIPTGGDASQIAVVEGVGLAVASANGGLTVIQTPLIPFTTYAYFPQILR